jgi:hypothetical protein
LYYKIKLNVAPLQTQAAQRIASVLHHLRRAGGEGIGRTERDKSSYLFKKSFFCLLYPGDVH